MFELPLALYGVLGKIFENTWPKFVCLLKSQHPMVHLEVYLPCSAGFFLSNIRPCVLTRVLPVGFTIHAPYSNLECNANLSWKKSTFCRFVQVIAKVIASFLLREGMIALNFLSCFP